jgi:cation diffusion facilitator family transporter
MSKKLKAASTSITVNVILLISKLLAAFFTGSIALIAESAHSLFDLVASLLAYIGIRIAQRPEDESHSYGHEKFESLSSFLQSVLIALTSVFVIYEAYEKLINPAKVENSEVGIILMVITIPITLFVSRYLARIAKEEGGSHALEADSAHFTTDVIGSAAVLLGLAAFKLGFPMGDALAAFVVAIIMLYISYHLLKETYYVFMDYNPKPEIMEDVKKIIHKHRGVSYHKLKARRAGSKVFVEFHIQVNPKLTVDESHELAMKIKRRLMKDMTMIKDVTIHVEPKNHKHKN